MTPATLPRWGLGAFFAAWATGVVFAVVGASVAAGFRPDAADDAVSVLLAALLAQGVGTVLAAWFITRNRGQGSLRADFGLQVRWPDVTWVLVGAALQIGAGILLFPLTLLEPDEVQGVVDAFADARDGPEIVAFAIAVVVVAPLAEELLFRGVLLRALMRRTSAGAAVLWSAVAFTGVHLVLDPSVGSAQALPALMLLGLVAAHQAVRTGTLSRPILLHAGFNLLTAIGILTL